MKVVIDTNVFIAAFISPTGKSNELLEHCATFHTLVCSEFILGELRAKLIDRFRRKPSDVRDALDLLRTRIQMVTPTLLEEPVSRDAEDDPILGTAITGEVERIITGDKDLLSLGSYRGIKIIKPAEFLAEEEAEQ